MDLLDPSPPAPRSLQLPFIPEAGPVSPCVCQTKHSLGATARALLPIMTLVCVTEISPEMDTGGSHLGPTLHDLANTVWDLIMHSLVPGVSGQCASTLAASFRLLAAGARARGCCPLDCSGVALGPKPFYLPLAGGPLPVFRGNTSQSMKQTPHSQARLSLSPPMALSTPWSPG